MTSSDSSVPAADTAAYCAKIAQIGTEVGKLQTDIPSALTSGDTAAAKKTLGEASDYFKTLQDGAPEELKSSLTTLATALSQAQDAFTSATPDQSKLAALLTSAGPAIQTFTQWGATNCAAGSPSS
jgi:hypothetical protein